MTESALQLSEADTIGRVASTDTANELKGQVVGWR